MIFNLHLSLRNSYELLYVGLHIEYSIFCCFSQLLMQCSCILVCFSKHIELPSGNISSNRRLHIELRSNISTKLWPEVATKLSLCTSLILHDTVGAAIGRPYFNATQLQFMKRQLQFMAIANSWPVGSIHSRLLQQTYRIAVRQYIELSTTAYRVAKQHIDSAVAWDRYKT